ncbi:MAG: biotin transporter BioY [Thermodesulfobacteriota bacterium]
MCDSPSYAASSRQLGDSSTRIRKMVLAPLLAALTGAASLIAIPVGPVPVTLQSLIVLASGGILGARWGALSMILYLAMGIAGLPVFAGGTSGLGRLIGPTGGYLLGFVVAAAVVGAMAARSARQLRLFLATLAGLAAVYAMGSVWLSVVAKLPMSKALMVGVLPFVPMDLLKAFLAALLIGRWRKRFEVP